MTFCRGRVRVWDFPAVRTASVGNMSEDQKKLEWETENEGKWLKMGGQVDMEEN